MSFLIIILSLVLLIVLISYFKVNAFLSFLIVSITAAVALGIPLNKIATSVENGVAASWEASPSLLYLAPCSGN